MAEFIKIGNEITIKPKIEGLNYELIGGKVYDLKYNRMEGKPYLAENGNLNMPKKLVDSTKNDTLRTKTPQANRNNEKTQDYEIS